MTIRRKILFSSFVVAVILLLCSCANRPHIRGSLNYQRDGFSVPTLHSHIEANYKTILFKREKFQINSTTSIYSDYDIFRREHKVSSFSTIEVEF